MLQATYRRAVDLIEGEIGDELVALDAEAGVCFGFNEVATSVWRELRRPRSLEELSEALLIEYDVEPEQCARELRELLDEMTAKALIKIT